MKVAPLADRVVVRPVDIDQPQMRGGLYIPDTAKEKPTVGEIIAVGPGKFEEGKRIPMELKVGDRVYYGTYSGTKVSIDGEDHVIIRESDVLAVIES
ncbi:MAG TPA: co-chaperone GroES [Gemmatimonadaceae bacterium]